MDTVTSMNTDHKASLALDSMLSARDGGGGGQKSCRNGPQWGALALTP